MFLLRQLRSFLRACPVLNGVIVATAATITLSQTALADGLMDRVSGTWTTYNVRMASTFLKETMEITPTTFRNDSEISIFLPLFEKEGMVFRLVADAPQASQSSEFADGIKLTMKIQSMQMKYKSEKSVTENNQKSYCGFSDWKVGEFKDVTGRRCKDDPEADDSDDDLMPNRGDELERVLVFKDGNVYSDIGFNDDSPFSSQDDSHNDDSTTVIDWKHPFFHP